MIRLGRTNDCSSAVIPLYFTDEECNSVVPLSVVWSLFDGAGDLVNARDRVELTPLDSTMYITLTPEDTAFADGDSRIITVVATYISSLLGSSLSVTEGWTLRITDLPELVEE